MRLRAGAAIVSGASSGIGRATARLLAHRGNDLVVMAAAEDEGDLTSLVSELSAHDTPVFPVVGDIADETVAAAAVDLALERFGRLNYLVNNAGTTAGGADLSVDSVAEFDRVMDVNVRGPYHLAVRAAQAMADGGAIVCTAGVSSWLGDEEDVAYNTTAGGLLMMVRTLGLEFAPYGVRVNGVAPSRIRTRMTEPLLADSTRWETARSRIPLNRAGEPEEVARVIAFLLSDESSFMFGSIIAVDGGASAGVRFTGEPTSPESASHSSSTAQ